MTNLFLSIVIPVYNEERRIADTLTRVLDYLGKQSYAGEIIVVDDGSQDNTLQIVQSFIAKHANISLITNPHSGKAFTVRTGVLAAQGLYVYHADADLSTPIEEFDKFLHELQQGADVVIGSRSGRLNAPWYRQIMSTVFTLMVRLLVIRGLQDTQCGFKAYRTEAAERIYQQTRLYSQAAVNLAAPRVTAGSDVEILYIARRLGYKISEVAVKWTYAGHTKVSPIRDSLQAVVDLLHIRWYATTGTYNAKRAEITQGSD